MSAAVRMRAPDRAEVLASDGWLPEQALSASMMASELSRVLLIQGEVAAVFGVRVLESGVAQPWALTTDTVERFPVSFVRASRQVLRELVTRYPVLVQCIDDRYKAALRWVELLGFRVFAPHRCGVEQLPFRLVLYVAPEGGSDA